MPTGSRAGAVPAHHLAHHAAAGLAGLYQRGDLPVPRHDAGLFLGLPGLAQKGDALYYANYFADKTFNPFVPYPIMAGYFIVLTLVIIAIFGLINRRLNRHLPQEARPRIRLRMNLIRSIQYLIKFTHGRPEGPQPPMARARARQFDQIAQGPLPRHRPPPLNPPDRDALRNTPRCAPSASPPRPERATRAASACPSRFADKVVEDGTRFPLSVLNLDIWGEDIDDSPLVFDSGDADGVLRPPSAASCRCRGWRRPPRCCRYGCSARTAAPMTATRAMRWRGARPLQGARADAGGRGRAGVLPDRRLGAQRCRCRSAPVGQAPQGRRDLSMRALDRSTVLHRSLRRLRGDGHPRRHRDFRGRAGPVRDQPDALRRRPARRRRRVAVQDAGQGAGAAARLRRLVHGQTLRGLPRQRAAHAFLGAGPDGQQRLRRRRAEGTDTAAPRHRRVPGGDADSTLVFAPHANSYDRLVPEAHAPTGICWAYENRTAAIRVPSGKQGAADRAPRRGRRRQPLPDAGRDPGRRAVGIEDGTANRPRRSPATPTRSTCRASPILGRRHRRFRGSDRSGASSRPN